MLRRTMLIGLGGLLAGAPVIGACSSSGGSKSGAKPSGERHDIAAELPRLKQFKLLTQYIRLAGLEDVLASPGPFTLFAPDDAAFGTAQQKGGGIAGGGARLDLAALKQPKNKDKLVRLLEHHIVAGQLDALAVQRAKSLRTLAGTALEINRQGQRVEIGTADLVRTNISASNGYIHVIDEVLVPPRS